MGKKVKLNEQRNIHENEEPKNRESKIREKLQSAIKSQFIIHSKKIATSFGIISKRTPQHDNTLITYKLFVKYIHTKIFLSCQSHKTAETEFTTERVSEWVKRNGGQRGGSVKEMY